MNTQLVAKEVKFAQWNALVQECMASGLKVKDWCQQNNISKDAYYYWLRKLREAACDSVDTNFVRVPDQCIPSSFHSSFSTELTITMGSITINVNSSTPQCLIESTIRAVTNAE
ncbi:IS66 family insertion sequence element accessory protein TnpA [Variimorphobacter saccharofermentans]